MAEIHLELLSLALDVCESHTIPSKCCVLPRGRSLAIHGTQFGGKTMSRHLIGARQSAQVIFIVEYQDDVCDIDARR